MKPFPLDELRVEYLRETHDLSSFHCRNDDLNDFLKSDAIESQEDLISRTYLCLWHDTILGYLALVTDTIEVKLIEKDDCVADYPYPRYPSIKIARLAVEEKFEGRGIGRFLLFWATGKVYHQANGLPCQFHQPASATARLPEPAAPSHALAGTSGAAGSRSGSSG